MVERGAWRLLLALAALNVLGYVDRQLVASLAPVLMAELGLSRADIGLLIGPVFVVVFGLTTLFLGAAADRWPRPRIIAGGLAVWSAATALTGTASGFGTLAVVARARGRGRGGAAADRRLHAGRPLPVVPPRLRDERLLRRDPGGLRRAASRPPGGSSPASAGARASSCSGRSASSRSRRCGGWPTRRGARFRLWWRWGRRATACRATGCRLHGSTAGARATAGRLRRAFADRPALGFLVAGATLLTYTSASSQHLVTWLVQERGLPYSRAAYLASAVILAAGIVGSLALGAVTDAAERLRPGGRLYAFVLLGAASLGMTTVFYLLPPSSPFFLGAWFVSQAWTLGWFGPMLAALHGRAPAESRAHGDRLRPDDDQRRWASAWGRGSPARSATARGSRPAS